MTQMFPFVEVIETFNSGFSTFSHNRSVSNPIIFFLLTRNGSKRPVCLLFWLIKPLKTDIFVVVQVPGVWRSGFVR